MIQIPKSAGVISQILKANSFNYEVPLILVFRNTAIEPDIQNSTYIPDVGDNCCDSILLIDDNDILALVGRSLPHKKYQAQQITGEGRANYIVSQYVAKAFRKGLHNGRRALVQNVKFVIFRSKDEILGNSDDYNEYDIVADNFHGFAPMSAGCITVVGNMASIDGKVQADGDWKIAYDWIYGMNNTFFNACILNHYDLKGEAALRLGSFGDRVYLLQEALRTHGYEDVKPDGDFGPFTHERVRDYQLRAELNDSGIVDTVTAQALGVVL
jgi:hypothetical protein